MKSITPVVEGLADREVVLGADQPQYDALPALPATVDGNIILITRWRMSWRERLHALLFGDVFLRMMTFGQPPQPVHLAVTAPRVERAEGSLTRDPVPAAEPAPLASTGGIRRRASEGKDSAEGAEIPGRLGAARPPLPENAISAPTTGEVLAFGSHRRRRGDRRF